MDSKNIQAKRFFKQLMLHRYKTLLKRLQLVYSLPDETITRLEDKILNTDWLT